MIIEQINKWCNSTIDDLITEYESSGRRASGNWKEELDKEVTENDKGYNIKITGAGYTEFMENGRPPNRNQSPDAIRAFVGGFGKNVISEWCRNKGIAEVFAFPIAYKIATQGYEGKPFIEKVLSNEKIEDLAKSIGLAHINNIKLGQWLKA